MIKNFVVYILGTSLYQFVLISRWVFDLSIFPSKFESTFLSEKSGVNVQNPRKTRMVKKKKKKICFEEERNICR
jgi:hypothetical protein